VRTSLNPNQPEVKIARYLAEYGVDILAALLRGQKCPDGSFAQGRDIGSRALTLGAMPNATVEKGALEKAKRSHK